MRLTHVLVVGAVLVAGLAGAIATLSGRGAEEAFLHDQRTARPLRITEVEGIVRTAPDPVDQRHPGGIAADCRPRGSGPLRNPWSCTVRYRSGARASFAIEMREDGSYVGRHAGGTGTVKGCCVATGQ